MKKAIKIVLRVIVFPFFSAIALIHTLFLWLLFSYNFLRHGGEAVAYTKRFNGKTMTETLEKINDMLSNGQNVQASVATEGESSNQAD